MANIFVAVIDAGVTNGTDVKVVDVAAEADVVVVDAADVLVFGRQSCCGCCG